MDLHEGAGPDDRISKPNMFDQTGYPVSTLPDASTSAERAGNKAGTRKLVINGRFLTQPLTGVQRYAREVVKAMDTLAAERHPAALPWDIELHHPSGDIQFDTYRHIRIRQTGKRTGHLWEQVDLCASARGSLLLNLANTAPVLHPAIVGTIHDVGVFAHGSAYSASFRLSYRLMFRFLVRRARRLFTVSSFSAQEIGRYCGIPPDAVAVAPNAADHLGNSAEDPEILDRLGLKPQEFVLAVGSRNPLKNLTTVMRAFGRLGPDRPRLVIVGQRSAAIFQNAAGQDADNADGDFIVSTGEKFRTAPCAPCTAMPAASCFRHSTKVSAFLPWRRCRRGAR